MRAGQLAAVMAAVMMAHGIPAAGAAPVSAGLDTASGMDILGVSAQPGLRLADTLRLRLTAPIMMAEPGQKQLVDAQPRPRRIASMLDYYPQGGGGFHVSAGMRLLAKKGRVGWSPSRGGRPGSLLYAPAMIATMPDRNNLARTAPAATVGWTAAVAGMATFGIEAGVIQEHGRTRTTMVSIAQPRLASSGWSRIDPVAQVAFAFKF